ncbi:hypothetical protein [Pseudoalteromonas sp.]|uniref:GNAT family N-acetyltransferase n=1 Tax=Pseudoalteromonas aliena SW19 TaxID=1314866 RepID=A0ABR9E6U7_9GAMM|nr:hypothetical protein [Pseudoalteromonas sp.]MBE0361586.1 hypothetical protein [Pseudoalteromonas aliena SW19]
MNAVFKTNRLLLRHANASDAAVLLRLGRVDLWWVNLQQTVWFLGKAEPM